VYTLFVSISLWWCIGVWDISTHDFEGVGDDADGHELLAVVAAVHHQGVGEALNDGALGLAEPLDGIPAGAVWDVDGLADLDVISVVPSLLACHSLFLFPVILMTHVKEMSLISTSS